MCPSERAVTSDVPFSVARLRPSCSRGWTTWGWTSLKSNSMMRPKPNLHQAEDSRFFSFREISWGPGRTATSTHNISLYCAKGNQNHIIIRSGWWCVDHSGSVFLFVVRKPWNPWRVGTEAESSPETPRPYSGLPHWQRIPPHPCPTDGERNPAEIKDNYSHS